MSAKCPGYDDDGKGFNCPNPPGTPWTPVWCGPCDEKRKARITNQLKAIANTFRGGL